MVVFTLAIFTLIALAAAAFVVWPVMARRGTRGRFVLAAAAVLFVLGAGGGLYLTLGQPQLAARTLAGTADTSPNALIGRLAKAVVRQPADPRGWALLGQAYERAGDAADAASAFARAIGAAGAMGQHYSFLYAAYGQALTESSAGAVTPDAEAAFAQALSLDPKDMPSRFFLGLAAAARGNAPRALAFWNDLLADAPPNSPLHAELVDRIAALTARSGGGAPDVGAMVAGLATRLKAHPDDARGWLLLIRAYAVMGDKDKAHAALADARRAAHGRSDRLTALDTEAKALGL